MGKTRRKKEYYYAGGQRIPITIDTDYLAVQRDSMTSPKLSKKASKQLAKLAKPLRDGVCLVNRPDLDREVDAEFVKKCDTYPVYRHEDVLLVGLPEIRIEEDTATRARRVDGWLEDHSDEAQVVSRKPGRIVVRPVAGTGQEALRLANELHESIGPKMVQARFLRIVPQKRIG